MSTYLILSGTVGLLLAVCSVAMAVDAADRQIGKRRSKRELSELQRQARAAWERTLQQLQTESSKRQVAARRLAAGIDIHPGTHGKARRRSFR